jgi:hypothetical protein
LAGILNIVEAALVRTAVGQFVRKFGGDLSLQLLQLEDFGFDLDSLLDSLISSCYSCLVRCPWKEVRYLVWLSSIGFASEMILCQG